MSRSDIPTITRAPKSPDEFAVYELLAASLDVFCEEHAISGRENRLHIIRQFQIQSARMAESLAVGNA